MPKRTTGDRPELKPFNVGAAAIDIGSKLHMAAVAPTCTDTPVRAFGTFTQDLHDLADWFKACGVTSVAMESTGVYWIPAYEILEQRGFEVILVNARYAKNVPGRKTDVSDAAWLRQLHSYGLLRGSFRPDAEIATLRAYLRQRERLVEYAAAHIQYMQKALMEMNLQLHHVVSDITGGPRQPEAARQIAGLCFASSSGPGKGPLFSGQRWSLSRRFSFQAALLDGGGHSRDRHKRAGDLVEQLVRILFFRQRLREKSDHGAMAQLLREIASGRVAGYLVMLDALGRAD
jgi:Transposase